MDSYPLKPHMCGASLVEAPGVVFVCPKMVVFGGSWFLSTLLLFIVVVVYHVWVSLPLVKWSFSAQRADSV